MSQDERSPRPALGTTRAQAGGPPQRPPEHLASDAQGAAQPASSRPYPHAPRGWSAERAWSDAEITITILVHTHTEPFVYGNYVRIALRCVASRARARLRENSYPCLSALSQREHLASVLGRPTRSLLERSRLRYTHVTERRNPGRERCSPLAGVLRLEERRWSNRRWRTIASRAPSQARDRSWLHQRLFRAL